MDETFGRYRLLERLGQGGMAEVFKAKSFGVEGFEKILVIKRILPELARSRRFSEMFVHEAKLAVRLSHTNIVQVFDLGTVAEEGRATYFIAMEYVAGLDLATLLGRCREQQVELPVGMCVYVAAEVAKGLDHAHRRRDEQMQPLGIVHRDISPQNILLSWEGEVKVADFGIAKARDTLEFEPDSSTVALPPGKHAYMSPEQVRGQSVDARSDLFSVGVVLYQMLTGVNPFRAPTTLETLRRVDACEFPPLELLRADLPKGISSLVAKALAPLPEQRFVDAARMYESLVSYLYASGDRFGANELSAFVRRFRVASVHPRSLEPDEMAAEIPVYDEDETPLEIPASARTSSIGPFNQASVSAAAARASELGERRDVTALVFRYGGSGAVRALRHERVHEIVTRYGGEVIEDEPTHLAALFGLAEPDGRDTETAVRCALLSLRRAANTGARSSPPNRPHGPSAGIHTGRVLVLPTGEPKRDERLSALFAAAEEVARLGDRSCGISRSASRHVSGLFRFERAGGADSEGRPSTDMVVKELRTPFEGLGRFVGRRLELRRIGEILSLATRHHPHVLTLRGPPGIGKTRLLYETERRLRKNEYRVSFYLAACPPNGGATPFSGLTAMLQVLCGIKEGDPEERVAEVEPRLRALGLREEEVGAVLSQLGASRKGGWSAAALRSAFGRMVLSLCSDQLHVFAWDHAQALDDTSFETLSHALLRADESRAVFVFSIRDDAPAHPLESHPNHHLLTIGELDRNESRELIARRAQVADPPPELVEFCRERAKGHPLFIEELIKELRDSGALVVADRNVVEWKTGGEMAVPRPLRALVAARAIRLAPDEKWALQAAAILGEPVELAILSLMQGEPLSRLDRMVNSLEERGFVRRCEPASIAFASPLIAEVIADALPVEALRQMHAAAAFALESAQEGRTLAQFERVAEHLFRAGDRQRAAHYFARSAERKLADRRYDGAARDALRAFELCEPARQEPTELAAWLARLAAAVYRVRVARELPGLVGPVLAHIDRAGDIPTRVGARIDLASIFVSTHDFDAADQCLQTAKALAEGQLPDLLRAAVLTEAELARRRGDYLSAMRHFEELSRLGTESPEGSHRVLMGLALSFAAAGAPARAKETLASAEALPTASEIALVCERAKVRQVVALMSRDFAEAIRTGQTAVELAREAGLTYEIAINLHLLGEGLFRAGELPRAYAAFQQSAALCEETAEERLLAHDRSFLAFLDGTSDFEGACRTLEESIAYAHAHRYVRDEVNARYLLATLQRDDGQYVEARAEFERCQRLARSVGFRIVVEDCDQALTW